MDDVIDGLGNLEDRISSFPKEHVVKNRYVIRDGNDNQRKFSIVYILSDIEYKNNKAYGTLTVRVYELFDDNSEKYVIFEAELNRRLEIDRYHKSQDNKRTSKRIYFEYINYIQRTKRHPEEYFLHPEKFDRTYKDLSSAIREHIKEFEEFEYNDDYNPSKYY